MLPHSSAILFLHKTLDGSHDMQHHLLLVVPPDDLDTQGAASSAPARLPGQPVVGVSVGVVSLQRRLVLGALPGHWEDASWAADQVVDRRVA